MDALFQIILPMVLLYKYWAIFLITFVAALIFPFPPGTLLMASSAFAKQGYFSFWLIVLFGTLGNIVGDSLGYWLARIYGKEVLYRIGFRKILDSQRFQNVNTRIKSNPGFFIFLTRFEVFSNLAGNIICGLSKVPYRKYLFYDILGETTQVLLYCTIGYILGDNWHAISSVINRSLFLIILLIIVFVAIFWKRLLRWVDGK
jgi:membrane protein DedA with SNARE-associated domain